MAKKKEALFPASSFLMLTALVATLLLSLYILSAPKKTYTSQAAETQPVSEMDYELEN